MNLTRIKEGLMTLRKGNVEPLGLSIKPGRSQFAWMWCWYKGLPTHKTKPGQIGAYPEFNLADWIKTRATNDEEIISTEKALTIDVNEIRQQIAVPILTYCELPLEKFDIVCAWVDQRCSLEAQKTYKVDLSPNGRVLYRLDIVRDGLNPWQGYPDVCYKPKQQIQI